MKKNFIFACLILIISAAFSQGKTLQFNQVLMVGSTVQTVPSGKVWKVEGVAGGRVTYFRYSTTADNEFTPSENLILINGTPVSVIHTVATGAGAGTGSSGARTGVSYTASPTSFPLWLPEGWTLSASTNVSYISVIEFNVITP